MWSSHSSSIAVCLMLSHLSKKQQKSTAKKRAQSSYGEVPGAWLSTHQLLEVLNLVSPLSYKPLEGTHACLCSAEG